MQCELDATTTTAVSQHTDDANGAGVHPSETRPNKSQLQEAKWASVPPAVTAKKVSMVWPMEMATTTMPLSNSGGASDVVGTVTIAGGVDVLTARAELSPSAPRLQDAGAHSENDASHDEFPDASIYSDDYQHICSNCTHCLATATRNKWLSPRGNQLQYLWLDGRWVTTVRCAPCPKRTWTVVWALVAQAHTSNTGEDSTDHTSRAELHGTSVCTMYQ